MLLLGDIKTVKLNVSSEFFPGRERHGCRIYDTKMKNFPEGVFPDAVHRVQRPLDRV